MRTITKDWRTVELKPGDMIVVYRGTSTLFTAYENSVTLKGNIKRDEAVKNIQSLIVGEY